MSKVLSKLRNSDSCSLKIHEDDVIESLPAAPVSYLGKLSKGVFFYFRARHAHWTLGFGKTEDKAVENSSFGGRWCTNVKHCKKDKDCHCASWMPHHIALAIIEWYSYDYLKNKENKKCLSKKQATK